jgi:DNA-binding CsgD family transcriptional regulator
MSLPHDIGTLLDLVYRVDLPTADWQREIAAAILELLPGAAGVLAYEFDARDPAGAVRLGSIASVGAIDAYVAQTDRFHGAMSGKAYWEVLKNGTGCTTIRRQLGRSGLKQKRLPALDGSLRAAGFADVWGLWAVNPDARGIVFAEPLRGGVLAAPRKAGAWRLLAAHLASSYRLRTSLAGMDLLSHADALYYPGGREAHLSDEAKPLRTALGRFVRAIEETRRSDFSESRSALLSLWKGLVAGRYSVVDHVDSDGKRFLVLVENEPAVEAPGALTPREAQVATYAAQGHSNKFIAYELGIAESTVATLMARALAKLGLRSRLNLVWLYGVLQGSSIAASS